MIRFFIVLFGLLFTFSMMEKGCEASDALDAYMPDRGYGPMSRAKLDSIKSAYDALYDQNQRLLAQNRTLTTQNVNLFDLLSTQQKEFIALSVMTGVGGFVLGCYFGYDAGYQIGYSTGLGAAVPTVCAVAKPIIQTIYQNVTEYIPFYQTVTEYLPCNATEVVYLQPERLVLDAEPIVTVRRSLLGSLVSKIFG